MNTSELKQLLSAVYNKALVDKEKISTTDLTSAIKTRASEVVQDTINNAMIHTKDIPITTLADGIKSAINERLALRSMYDTLVSAFLELLDWSNIRNRPTEYTPSAHKHTYTDVLDTPKPKWSDVTGKPTAYKPIQHNITEHTAPNAAPKDVLMVSNTNNLVFAPITTSDVNGLEERLDQASKAVTHYTTNQIISKIAVHDNATTNSDVTTLVLPDNSIVSSTGHTVTIGFTSYEVFNISASASISKSGYYIVNTSSALVNVTIPDSSSSVNNTSILIHFDAGTNPIEIHTISNESIEGDTMLYMRSRDTIIWLVNDSLSWHILQHSATTNNVIEYYRTTTDDGTIANYKLLSLVPPSDTSVSTLITATDQLLSTHITPSGYPNLFSLSGILKCVSYVKVDATTGYKAVQVYAKTYKRNVAGTETLIGTSNTGLVLTTSITQCVLETVVSTTLGVTDRIVVKTYAILTGSGNNPTLTSYLGATYPNRIELPSTSLPNNLMYTNTYDTNADGKIDLSAGGTGVDLSSSGGTGYVLTQDASHAISARALTTSDLPTGTLMTSAALDSTLRAVQDKDGTSSALALSTSGISVGTTTPITNINQKVLVYDTTVTAGQSSVGYYSRFFPTIAATQSGNTFGMLSSTYPVIANGATASGQFVGVYGQLLRGLTNGGGDDGTLAEAEGLYFGAGHYTYASNTTVTTTLAGAYISLYRQGTAAASGNSIGTLYGLRVQNTGTTATVGTQYGVYINLSATNVTTAYSFYNNNTSRFMAKLPTSSTGLATGELWCDTSDSNRVKQV